MRILYINTLYSPHLLGGAERVLQMQAEEMASAGNDVAVLTIGADPGLAKTSVNGIPVWRAGIRNTYFHFDELQARRYGRLGHNLWHLFDSYNPLMASYVRRVAQLFRPDVASCHNLAGWSISAWDALTRCNVPIVQVLHDQYLLCPTSMMYRGDQRCVNQCMRCRLLRWPHRRRSAQIDTVVGVSQFICNKLTGQGLFRGVRTVKVIPNIRIASPDALLTEPRTNDDQMVFGYLGRLTHAKGIEFLLEAFSRAGRQEWKLIVAGSGESDYEGRLKKRFNRRGIEFAGHVAPGDFFHGIDCTVVPSVWEDTLPSVVFESLLYGRPVLASDVGGIPEMVNPNNGKLVRPGDREELFRGLQEMALRKKHFQQRLRAIQEDASIYRDKQGWIRKWSEVYSAAIEASRYPCTEAVSQ